MKKRKSPFYFQVAAGAWSSSASGPGGAGVSSAMACASEAAVAVETYKSLSRSGRWSMVSWDASRISASLSTPCYLSSPAQRLQISIVSVYFDVYL